MPAEHYKRIYFEALDLIVSSIKNRFDQPGYHVYCKLEELLLKAASGVDYEEELVFVTDFYSW